MASYTTSGAVPRSPRGLRQILRSYFYWDYPRGSIQYDVMVTLILLFIFVAPHLWNFGARPTPVVGISHPIQVVGNGTGGLLITVQAEDVKVSDGASDREVRNVLRKAIEPVTGDAVSIERWKTFTDPQGNLEWQVWAHR